MKTATLQMTTLCLRKGRPQVGMGCEEVGTLTGLDSLKQQGQNKGLSTALQNYLLCGNRSSMNLLYSNICKMFKISCFYHIHFVSNNYLIPEHLSSSRLQIILCSKNDESTFCIVVCLIFKNSLAFIPHPMQTPSMVPLLLQQHIKELLSTVYESSF